MSKFLRVFLFFVHLAAVFAWGPKKKTLVVRHKYGQDDAPGLVAALQNYSTDSVILFKSGTTYNISTPVKFPVFTNVEVRIEGNITLPDDIATVQGMYEQSLITHTADMHLGSRLAIVGSSVRRLICAIISVWHLYGTVFRTFLGIGEFFPTSMYHIYILCLIPGVQVFILWRNQRNPTWISGSGVGMGEQPWSSRAYSFDYVGRVHHSL